MSVETSLKSLIGDVLQLGSRVEQLTPSTPLLGNIPELDSMAVATLITAIEDQFGIFVDDDEVSAETFETFGSLVQFVDSKVAGG